MKTLELFSYLNTLNIKLWLEEDKLKYQAPPGVMTTEIKQKISTKKKEIIAFLKGTKHISQEPQTPITKVAREGDLPLSFSQQRMWFLYQMDQQNPSYNEALAIKLTGDLNLEILEKTINEIVQRHEILRTSFPTIEGKPIQKISPSLAIKLLIIDLKNHTEKEVEDILIQELQKPFDLSQAPLLRCTLFDLGSQNYILIKVFHHIIVDGWSKNVLFQEISEFYQSLLTNKPISLPELSIQYADFAVWQRQWLQGEILEKQLNYWKKQLATAPPLLELPTDQPRPAICNFKGNTLYFKIDSNLTEKLNNLSKKTGVTLFMTLLSAFYTLLFRYTNQNDILIGTPTANRNRQEIEPLIGFFVNTVVIRNYLNGDLSFVKLLEKVRQVVLEAYANQNVPFEQVLDALEIERNLSYNPLFQVMFALQNIADSSLNLPGVNAKHILIENKRIKFDLTLVIEEIAGEEGSYLKGFWEYDTDLFTQERINRFNDHFQILLEGIINNPEQTLGTLPILTAKEKQQLLIDWNQTKTIYPKDKSIHQLFEEQVIKNPDAIAVIYEEESLTYQQLNEKANQLAHYLQKLGVKPEDIIGVCLERSVELIIAFIGIIKAGGVYLPIDPNYPQERINYVLSDAKPSLILIKEKQGYLFSQESTPIINLDRHWHKITEASSSNNPENRIKPENLAYIIYTSGSTGKPKGVMVCHQGLPNLAQAQIETFKVKANSRIWQFASLSFDASIFEILMAVITGASLYLASSESFILGSELREVINRHKITHITLPPSALATLPETQLPSLEAIIIAGETCPIELAKKWSVGRSLYNAYGPTEATVWATTYQCQPDDNKLPIGRPIPNTQIYILDESLQPVPIGVSGEIYLGGIAIARGYLNRPELSAQKFVNNPFGEGKLYKTGDLGQYLADGNIEFIGRIDHQVKIRGFRIELGEIEAVLLQHSQVKNGIVIARKDQFGINRLYAYIVPKTKQLTEADLRNFLKEKLPNYMIPAFLIFLDSFPLTQNGKIDRNVLPIPEIESNESENYLLPSTEKEIILAQIWQDVLGRKKISINDNFFELGGDSIIAIQIVAKANEAGLKITPKQLFSHQTIAQLAVVAQTTNFNEINQGLVTGNVPLTPIQKWFFEKNSPEPEHFNQAMMVDILDTLQPELLQTAISKLIYHHDALRLHFQQQDQQWQQAYSEQGDFFSFEVVNLADLSENEQLINIENIANQKQRSLNLEKGLLTAVVLFQLGNRNKLLIIIHHLAVDGVSWRILLEDLATAYQQLEQGKTVELPPKTSSFKDWSEALQIYAQQPDLKSKLNYWLNQDLSKVNPLPRDYQNDLSFNTVGNSDKVWASLSEAQTQALLKDVPQAYNTQINDILLTALVQTFHHWTNFSSLLLNLEAHGRENIVDYLNLSRTVGWFTSIFPICLTLKNPDDLEESVKLVKEQLRSIPNKGIDYGIGDYLKSGLNLNVDNQVQPEISFNYLGQFTEEQIGNLKWQFSQELIGSIHSPLSRRSHLIEFNGIIINGKLTMEWAYSKKFHQKITIEKLAQSYQNYLENLIDHCLSAVGSYTPSDFPDADLSQSELDELLLELN